MAQLITGVDPEEVRQSAKHRLFVEGSTDGALDPVVLGEWLRGIVDVSPLGPCYSVKNAAEALHPHHPTYYFLIDRDREEDLAVEETWRSFPDPSRNNLLIWRRKELESYFVIPDFLCRSTFLAVSQETLKDRIRTLFEARLYLEIVNSVILSKREILRRKWIPLYTSPVGFENEPLALNKLVSRPEWQAKANEVVEELEQKSLEQSFAETKDVLTGGVLPLVFGIGRWLELMPAKSVFNEIMDTCFTVKDYRDRPLNGAEKRKQVVLDLLKMSISDLPADLRELHQILSSMILG